MQPVDDTLVDFSDKAINSFDNVDRKGLLNGRIVLELNSKLRLLERDLQEYRPPRGFYGNTHGGDHVDRQIDAATGVAKCMLGGGLLIAAIVLAATAPLFRNENHRTIMIPIVSSLAAIIGLTCICYSPISWCCTKSNHNSKVNKQIKTINKFLNESQATLYKNEACNIPVLAKYFSKLLIEEETISGFIVEMIPSQRYSLWCEMQDKLVWITPHLEPYEMAIFKFIDNPNLEEKKIAVAFIRMKELLKEEPSFLDLIVEKLEPKKLTNEDVRDAIIGCLKVIHKGQFDGDDLKHYLKQFHPPELEYDLELCVGKISFPTMRARLEKYPYFQPMLDGKFKEKIEPGNTDEKSLDSISLDPETDVEGLKLVISYINTGKVDVSNYSYEQLLQCSYYYQVMDLVYYCQEEIIKEIGKTIKNDPNALLRLDNFLSEEMPELSKEKLNMIVSLIKNIFFQAELNKDEMMIRQVLSICNDHKQIASCLEIYDLAMSQRNQFFEVYHAGLIASFPLPKMEKKLVDQLIWQVLNWRDVINTFRRYAKYNEDLVDTVIAEVAQKVVGLDEFKDLWEYAEEEDCDLLKQACLQFASKPEHSKAVNNLWEDDLPFEVAKVLYSTDLSDVV